MKLFSFCAYQAFFQSQHDWNNSKQMLQFDEKTHSSAEGVQALGLCNQQWTSSSDCWHDALPGSHLRKNLHLEQMDASERQQW